LSFCEQQQREKKKTRDFAPLFFYFLFSGDRNMI